MQSRTQTGDDANGSFGPDESRLQDSRSGVEISESQQQAVAESDYRRTPSEDKSRDQAPLAERIRRRTGE